MSSPQLSSPQRARRLRAGIGLVAVALAAAAGATAASAPAALASPTATSATALAVTPPMGWNDWAHYQCGFTESTILANAQALVSTGLAAKGYNTVTIDDCWMQTGRDANGNLQADPGRFPDGIPYVSDKIHALGLKFGIYEDAGTSTCGGYAGSWGHWQADANLFASWGVDYLKLDGCNVPSVSGQTSVQTYQSAYSQMSAALAATGRPIVFSESAPAYFQGTPDWYTVLGWVGQYGQLWREGYDIATYDSAHPNNSRWGSVLGNYGYNNQIHRYESPGNWNDPDFVIAGDGGLTSTESQSQLSLWAEMGAPLILSSNVASLSAASVAQLGNSDVIAVDQDSLGKSGYLYSQNGTIDELTRPLAGGDRAVAILNRGSSAATVTTSAAAAGFAGGSGCSYSVKDLWSGVTSSSSGSLSATVPAHGTALLRVSASAGCAGSVDRGQVSGAGGKCVDDSGSGTADGNPVILWGCSGNANQSWVFGADGTVRTLGKCLDVPGSATAAGTFTDLRTCDGSAGQQWSYRANGNLVNPHSGLCLDVYGGGSTAGTKLDVWTCGANQDNQIWSIPRA